MCKYDLKSLMCQIPASDWTVGRQSRGSASSEGQDMKRWRLEASGWSAVGPRDHRTLVKAVAPGPRQPQPLPSASTVALIGSVDDAGTVDLHGNTLKTRAHSAPWRCLTSAEPGLANPGRRQTLDLLRTEGDWSLEVTFFQGPQRRDVKTRR